MPFGKPIELLEATARTYKVYGDEVERFLCPSCGVQQDVYEEFTQDQSGSWFAVETCMHCEAKVRVTYRRMFRKNF